MPFYVAIQGAAKNSVLLACDEKLQIVSCLKVGPLAFHVNVNIRDELKRFLTRLAESLRLKGLSELNESMTGLAVTISGAYLEAHRVMVKEMLREIGISPQTNLSVTEDVWANMATNGIKTGLLASVSTGSNVFFKKSPTEFFTIGGWGSELSDPGSGFHIGFLALRRLLEDMDGRRKATTLFKASLLETLQVTDAAQVTTWYQTLRPTCKWRCVISDLAIIVNALHEFRSDKTSLEILIQAEKRFASSLRAAASRYVKDYSKGTDIPPLEVLIDGGVALHSKHYRDFLLQSLGAESGICNLVKGKPFATKVRLGAMHPSVGTLSMAVGGSVDGLAPVELSKLSDAARYFPRGLSMS